MNAKQSRRKLVEAALPGTPASIGEKTGLARSTVWRWLTAIHAEGGCHIASWQRNDGGGPFVPTYVKGPGKDARCKLKPFTEKEKSRRYRKAARADGRWEDRNAKVRARYAADHADFAKDPLLAAMFRR